MQKCVHKASHPSAVTIDKGTEYKPQEQVQHQNAKKSQHRELKLPYFTNVNSNVTNNYSASVLMGELSPWQHLTACSPCQEVAQSLPLL